MPAHSPPPPIASIAENIRLRPKASCIGRSENCSATVTTDMDENDVMVPAAQPIICACITKIASNGPIMGAKKPSSGAEDITG